MARCSRSRRTRSTSRKLPIPTHALKDGGPYFDAAVVIAKDPETGIRNASIQRFMVVAKDRMNINIDAGRHLETYLDKAAKKGEALPFTLNVGVGPGVHFAAATPSEAAPIDTDELGIASAFQGSPLELVPSTQSDVEMIAHAMYALECEMVPGEVDDEGPFAEVTGYYAKRAPRPVVHVKAIHHRKEPVFQTILSGVEVWNSVGLLGEANVHGAAPAPGAGRQGRLLQPRRLRLLPLRRRACGRCARAGRSRRSWRPSRPSRRSRWSPWSTTTSTSATPWTSNGR